MMEFKPQEYIIQMKHMLYFSRTGRWANGNFPGFLTKMADLIEDNTMETESL